jgi:gluconokinase
METQAPSLQPRAFVVMGVSGSGKTTVGRALASQLGCSFYDGDDFHPAANIAKMARREPLTDEDRIPWLDALRGLIEKTMRAGQSLVVACSALRESYRGRLLPQDRDLARRTLFLYLKITPELARTRVAQRKDHFMPAALIDSQFQVLEEPGQDAITLDASRPEEELVRDALAGIRKTQCRAPDGVNQQRGPG